MSPCLDIMQHNVEKWSKILQKIYSFLHHKFDHFSTVCMKKAKSQKKQKKQKEHQIFQPFMKTFYENFIEIAKVRNYAWRRNI